MNSFLRKIATKFIGIPLEEYEQLTSGVTLLEAEELLSQKANEVGKGIPDIKKILESVTTDQAMAVRCHDGWLPLKVRFYTSNIIRLALSDHQINWLKYL